MEISHRHRVQMMRSLTIMTSIPCTVIHIGKEQPSSFSRRITKRAGHSLTTVKEVLIGGHTKRSGKHAGHE